MDGREEEALRPARYRQNYHASRQESSRRLPLADTEAEKYPGQRCLNLTSS